MENSKFNLGKFVYVAPYAFRIRRETFTSTVSPFQFQFNFNKNNWLQFNQIEKQIRILNRITHDIKWRYENLWLRWQVRLNYRWRFHRWILIEIFACSPREPSARKNNEFRWKNSTSLRPGGAKVITGTMFQWSASD